MAISRTRGDCRNYVIDIIRKKTDHLRSTNLPNLFSCLSMDLDAAASVVRFPIQSLDYSLIEKAGQLFLKRKISWRKQVNSKDSSYVIPLATTQKKKVPLWVFFSFLNPDIY